MENVLKILILHDYFLYKGGGERLVISLAKNLGADVATAFIAKDAFDPREHGIRTIELYKEKAWSRVPGFRYLQVQSSFLFKTGFVKNYDVVIYSGDCLTAALRTGVLSSRARLAPTRDLCPSVSEPEILRSAQNDSKKSERRPVNIAYMHTPPRHLYDLYDERLRSYPWWKKIIFVPFVLFNRWRFLALARMMDRIVTNSKNTQARIKKYLGLDSIVVYPPCDTLPFKNLRHSERGLAADEESLSVSSTSETEIPPAVGMTSVGDYFFSWARLYDVKRVHLIAEAFAKMPDKKVVIASQGPEFERIKKIVEGHSNITLLGWIDDQQLLEYLGKSLATIYIPMAEDFGMTAVESMQAGKPVIGVAEGGLLEIIEDNKNGLMLKPDFTVDDLRLKILEMTPERVRVMEAACYETAKKFSEAAFVEGMREVIEKYQIPNTKYQSC